METATSATVNLDLGLSRIWQAVKAVTVDVSSPILTAVYKSHLPSEVNGVEQVAPFALVRWNGVVRSDTDYAVDRAQLMVSIYTPDAGGEGSLQSEIVRAIDNALNANNLSRGVGALEVKTLSLYRDGAVLDMSGYDVKLKLFFASIRYNVIIG